ncbi:hypothetical protein LTSEGIV_2774, partial [Salmonella enterica subsp. enterica serovar Give str. S5-487]
MEQASKVIGGDLRQFFNGNPFQYRHIFCDVD